MTRHPEFQPPFSLGIDIGGSKLLCGLLDAKGEIVETRKRFLNKKESAESILEIINQEAKSLMESRPVEKPQAIGVSVPGLVDREAGIWKHAPYSGIDNFPVAAELADQFNLPVFIENDVNACALAEKAFGACRDDEAFLWLTVSNGIGGALFLHGHLFTGTTGAAGEIGHTKVAYPGRACDCGRTGCLEAHASGRAIAMDFAQRKPDLSPEISFGSKEVADLARQGDPDAEAAFHEAGRCLGRAIGNASNLLDIPKVIMGGGVSSSLDLLMPSLTEALRETIFPVNKELPAVEYTLLGYTASLVGAAALTDPVLRKDYL